MYTSRLPMSTSARWPTSQGRSTSSVSLNRPSNVPVTVRKANLFTPQTKRPYSSGSSTAGKTTDKKYHKPLPDRDQQLRMFDNLVDYLKTNAPHLPLPEAKRFFSSVSTTETSRIFEFLIGSILPDFKINRLETDVPEALALVEYPYIRSVTKSSLVSVTTRQAAVSLLVIFDWLIHNSKLENKEDRSHLEDLNEKAIIFCNIHEHPERTQEPLTELVDELYPPVDFQAHQDELEELNVETEKLEAYLEDVADKEQDSNTLHEDIKKCEDYNIQIEEYLQSKIAEGVKIKHEHLKMKKQYEEELKRADDLRLAIQNHELSVDEVNGGKAILDDTNARLAKFREESKIISAEYEKYLKEQTEFIAELGAEKQRLILWVKPLLECSAEFVAEAQDWIVKLKRMPPDDPAMRDNMSIFIHQVLRMVATLKSATGKKTSEVEIQLQTISSSIMSLENECPRLQKAKIRTVTEIDEQELLEEQAEINARNEEKARKVAELKKKLRELQEFFTLVETEMEQELKRGKSEVLEMSQLYKETQEIKEKTCLVEGERLVREAQSRAKELRNARIIAEENKRILTKASNDLKRRLKARFILT